jgi:hypothetical protein
MAINTPESESTGIQPLSTVPTEHGEASDAEFRIPSIIRRSIAAFHRDLPRLLAERPGQWVAYRGDEQLGFAATKTELYHECFRRGLKRDEFLVRSVEPEMDEIVLGPGVLS